MDAWRCSGCSRVPQWHHWLSLLQIQGMQRWFTNLCLCARETKRCFQSVLPWCRMLSASESPSCLGGPTGGARLLMKSRHNNLLELETVFLALQHFKPLILSRWVSGNQHCMAEAGRVIETKTKRVNNRHSLNGNLTSVMSKSAPFPSGL